jgi:hypothetical protein
MRRALYWMCPRYVILFGHFSKRDQKESHYFPQKKKKRRKIYLDSFRRFPISLHFLKKTHLLSLFFFFFFFFREREKEREKRERETKYENSRASTETTTLKRRFEEKHFVGFLS